MTDDQRTGPPPVDDERATLNGYVQYQRDTLAMKCAGLTAQQLRERAVPPSPISLLGLVRHMADVERGWFRNVVNGESVPRYWPREDGTDGAFDVDTADPAEAFRVWREACARSRAVVGAAESLDVTGRRRGEDFSLRYILAHMIEEYARHNGHADFLRERIDGAVGE
ncbi:MULTISPECIES: DinB family protein [Streptomyces]|uniref:DinB family protein n=2 Tax=Streptomyces TaxID=1883 RepID=A0A420V9Q9_9ACTN|nr:MULTISPECIES: DinB family protein [Streptomyces]KNE82321.1 Mini-circle protein [Streptomyces fradiae]OFA55992.1 Mini-circle protein [Streptomyces fradiae]PQM25018.1 DinB family protein [Streptomyces xinghaiensis]RKM99068.1 DinB family protein [Streptomyces xinghaiensis]RNC76028.1 DinB family protein [Streptomyces xinghaiensis]